MGDQRLDKLRALTERVASRRVVAQGLFAAVVGIPALGGLDDAVRGPEPVRAGRRKGRRKSVKFDISVSQFQDDCLEAGGSFSGHFGEFSCCFPGWCQHCSTNTGRCKIVKTNRQPSGPGNVIDDDPAQVAE
jgi:hypothetical protein